MLSFFIILFIFGYAGSLMLRGSSPAAVHADPSAAAVRGSVTAVASLVAEHGTCPSVVVVCGLFVAHRL